MQSLGILLGLQLPEMEYGAEKCSESIITEPKCFTASHSSLIFIRSSILEIPGVRNEHILNGTHHASGLSSYQYGFGDILCKQ